MPPEIVVLGMCLGGQSSKLLSFGVWMSKAMYRHVLGGGFKYFLFSSLLGEMIQFD